MDLRKEIQKILEESLSDEHAEERLFGRILNRESLPVGYEIHGSIGQYVVTGTYAIPMTIKNQVIENVNLIKKYNFPKNKSFGVKIAEFRIDRSAVIFASEQLKSDSVNKILVIVDEETNSNGNIIYAIIRENILKTFYFAKSYIKQTPEKLRVDVVTSMDAVKNKKVY